MSIYLNPRDKEKKEYCLSVIKKKDKKGNPLYYASSNEYRWISRMIRNGYLAVLTVPNQREQTILTKLYRILSYKDAVNSCSVDSYIDKKLLKKRLDEIAEEIYREDFGNQTGKTSDAARRKKIEIKSELKRVSQSIPDNEVALCILRKKYVSLFFALKYAVTPKRQSKFVEWYLLGGANKAVLALNGFTFDRIRKTMKVNGEKSKVDIDISDLFALTGGYENRDMIRVIENEKLRMEETDYIRHLFDGYKKGYSIMSYFILPSKEMCYFKARRRELKLNESGEIDVRPYLTLTNDYNGLMISKDESFTVREFVKKLRDDMGNNGYKNRPLIVAFADVNLAKCFMVANFARKRSLLDYKSEDEILSLLSQYESIKETSISDSGITYNDVISEYINLKIQIEAFALVSENLYVKTVYDKEISKWHEKQKRETTHEKQKGETI